MNYFIASSKRDMNTTEKQKPYLENSKKKLLDSQVLNYLYCFLNTNQISFVEQQANGAQAIGNLEKLFDELLGYAAKHFKSSISLTLKERENTIVMSQHKNEVYMSSVLSTAFVLFAITQVYHSYVLDAFGKESEEDFFCYRYTLYVLNELCFNEFDKPISFPDNEGLGILFSKLKDKPNLTKLGRDIFYSSVAFALLHEISHAYLHHNEDNVSIENELEADKKAYLIFLDYCYDLQKNKIESVFKECINPYTYMAPMYLFEFYYIVYYTGGFLCSNHGVAEKEMFDQIVERKNAILETFYLWDKDVDPSEAYDLYNCYLDGEESFLRSFVASDKAGMLDTLKKRNHNKRND